MKPWTQRSRTDANFAHYAALGTRTRPKTAGNLVQTRGNHIAISHEREGYVWGPIGLVSYTPFVLGLGA